MNLVGNLIFCDNENEIQILQVAANHLAEIIDNDPKIAQNIAIELKISVDEVFQLVEEATTVLPLKKDENDI
ncbi:hypothetical protein ACFVS2_26655 [Brevibacillus sp. NPDC058079]|uniref:hypothetical protein n=1 Tax=Brevibacillus sp. NPDC058079 TaxID=3346330 RepID=UPI0036E2AA9A